MSLTVFGSLVAMSAPSHAQVTLKLHHSFEAGSLVERILLPFVVQTIQAKTQGSVTLETVRDSQPGTLLNRLKSEKLDVALGNVSTSPETFPRTSVFSLPNVGQANATRANKALQNNRSQLEGDFEGAHLMLLQAGAAKTLFSNLRPIHSLGAGVGQTIGTTSYIEDAISTGLGSSYKAFSSDAATQLVKAFEDGALTGIIATSSDLVRSPLINSVYFATEDLNLGRNVYWVAVSDKALSKLSTDAKSAFLSAFSEANLLALSERFDEAETKARSALEEQGLVFTGLERERAQEIQAAFSPLISSWQRDAIQAGFDGSKLLADVRAE